MCCDNFPLNQAVNYYELFYVSIRICKHEKGIERKRRRVNIFLLFVFNKSYLDKYGIAIVYLVYNKLCYALFK